MSTDTNHDREMRIGILNAFQAFMRDVIAIAEDCQHDATTALLQSAQHTAEKKLIDVLLAHPLNQPAKQS